MIPILELKTQYQEVGAELEEAVLRVMRSTRYILGSEVQSFEEEFAGYHGLEAGVGCGSGTEALHLALRALDLGPEDEVICPPFTFIATAGAVSLAGAVPRFADVDPDLYALDPEAVEAAITPKTRAVIVVHLFGHPAPLEPILGLAKKHGLVVIEDCAQATGASYQGQKVGTRGDFGCFSFFPSKNLGGLGDGGMVLARDAEQLEKVRKLRTHGAIGRYYHEMLGTNSRLDEIQAAALRVKLKYLDRWNEKRRQVAARYGDNLREVVKVPVESVDCSHVYHQYTVRVPERDQLKEWLEQRGVGSMIYYPVSLHLQSAFSNLGYAEGDFPVSEKAQAEVLSLPMFPELTLEHVDQISELVHGFVTDRVATTG